MLCARCFGSRPLDDVVPTEKHEKKQFVVTLFASLSHNSNRFCIRNFLHFANLKSSMQQQKKLQSMLEYEIAFSVNVMPWWISIETCSFLVASVYISPIWIWSSEKIDKQFFFHLHVVYNNNCLRWRRNSMKLVIVSALIKNTVRSRMLNELEEATMQRGIFSDLKTFRPRESFLENFNQLLYLYALNYRSAFHSTSTISSLLLSDRHFAF